MCGRKRKERASVSYNTILYSEAQGIATITLNRADKRNAEDAGQKKHTVVM
jgi:1,4-dihydroxy-2-naphthoyl-CoA synthase